MTARRWHVGDTFDVDGIHFRIRDGVKCRGDQVLEMLHSDGWRPVTFAIAFVVMDVLGQNEDQIYQYGRGGGYLRSALLEAYRDGWRVAWARLQEERARAAERRELDHAD